MSGKRLAAVLLAALMLTGAAGCSGIFDKEYYAVETYQDQAETEAADPSDDEDDEDAIGSISNYAALKRAITRLVSGRVESAQLQFLGYDGTISQDISTACWEVKSSTALGAFAVDYISYDLSRIVSYYQAEIYITYKRSAVQMEALEEIGDMAALAERLDEALRAGETYLVLEISAASVTADTVREYVQDAYYADPLACPVIPEIEVGMYPESGVDRIAEITLNYGLDSETLRERRQTLGLALDVMVAEALPEQEDAAESPAPEEETAPLSADEQQEQLYALCVYLAESCAVDETSGGTAWDALVQQTASSEGLAMALEAGCQAIGLGCQVVSGRYDGEAHCWNIVTLDGRDYHVDVSRWDAGESGVFLVGDAALWGSYWWDTSEYPVCEADYDAGEEAASGEASGEAAVSSS